MSIRHRHANVMGTKVLTLTVLFQHGVFMKINLGPVHLNPTFECSGSIHDRRHILMSSLVAVCLFLVPANPGQAQTLSNPSPPGTTIDNCEGCFTDVPYTPSTKVGLPAETNDLPDAASSSVSFQPESWNLADVQQPTRPRRDPIWDKKMWAAHLIETASMVFDVEMTHQGLAHHMCVEGNSDLSRHPSRGELYTDNLYPLAGADVMDWLLAMAGRHAGLPRWFWKPLGYMGPVYGTFLHIQGGVEWRTRCW